MLLKIMIKYKKLLVSLKYFQEAKYVIFLL